jgi:hypothetical protein
MAWYYGAEVNILIQGGWYYDKKNCISCPPKPHTCTLTKVHQVKNLFAYSTIQLQGNNDCTTTWKFI